MPEREVYNLEKERVTIIMRHLRNFAQYIEESPSVRDGMKQLYDSTPEAAITTAIHTIIAEANTIIKSPELMLQESDFTEGIKVQIKDMFDTIFHEDT